MEKSREAFRTISEVAEWLAVPSHVLRFWETKFSEVRPVKRAGGRRYYRPADMALLAGIKKLLHDDGMTIRGVRKVLLEQGVRHVASLAEIPGDEVFGSPALHGELWGNGESNPDEAPMILNAEEEERPSGRAGAGGSGNVVALRAAAAPPRETEAPAAPAQEKRLVARLRQLDPAHLDDVSALRALRDRLRQLRARLDAAPGA